LCGWNSTLQLLLLLIFVLLGTAHHDGFKLIVKCIPVVMMVIPLSQASLVFQVVFYVLNAVHMGYLVKDFTRANAVDPHLGRVPHFFIVLNAICVLNAHLAVVVAAATGTSNAVRQNILPETSLSSAIRHVAKLCPRLWLN
jgi:hypothetical protein